MKTSLLRFCSVAGAVLVAILTQGSMAHAGATPSAPEIDGASLSAALGVLAAGVLIVRSRRSGRR